MGFPFSTAAMIALLTAVASWAAHATYQQDSAADDTATGTASDGNNLPQDNQRPLAYVLSGTGLLQSSTTAEESALLLARSIRDGNNDASQKEQLKQAVTKQLDQRLQRQRTELAALKSKLKELETTLAARERNRERIIDRRVEELVDPSVNWSTLRSPGLPHSNPLPRVTGPAPGALKWPGPSTDAAGQQQRLMTGRASRWRPPTGGDTTNTNTPLQITYSTPLEWQTRLSEKRRTVREINKLLARESNRPQPDSERIDTLRSMAKNGLQTWQDHWAEYQSQLRMCQLDLDAVTVRLAGASQAFELAQSQYRAGQMQLSEVVPKETSMQTLQVSRQQVAELLERYTAVSTNHPELDPKKFDPAQLSSSADDLNSELPGNPWMRILSVDQQPNDSVSRDLNLAPSLPPATRDQSADSIAEWSEVVRLLTAGMRQSEEDIQSAKRGLVHRAQQIDALMRQLSFLEQDRDEPVSESYAIRFQIDSRNLQREDTALTRDLKKLAQGPPVEWRQAWNFYKHNLQLLELNLEEAALMHDGAVKEMERLKLLTESGVASGKALRESVSRSKITEFELQRAKQRLVLFAGIIDEDPRLDPSTRDVDGIPTELPPLPAELTEAIQKFGKPQP
jgi:hypothetical protein